MIHLPNENKIIRMNNNADLEKGKRHKGQLHVLFSLHLMRS